MPAAAVVSRRRSRDYWESKAKGIGPEVALLVNELFDSDKELSKLRVVQAIVGMLLNGSGPMDKLGTAVASAGDVDKDGWDDVLIGAPEAPYDLTRNRQGPGLALVCSGKDGRILHRLSGSPSGTFFGTWVSGVGDIDADGRPDAGVGSRYEGSSSYVRVYSGATGTLLHTIATPNDGGSVGSYADVNADGYADYLVGGRYGRDVANLQVGWAKVISGRDASTLTTVFGSSQGDLFGSALAAAGDLDRDGTPDFRRARSATPAPLLLDRRHLDTPTTEPAGRGRRSEKHLWTAYPLRSCGALPSLLHSWELSRQPSPGARLTSFARLGPAVGGRASMARGSPSGSSSR